jgi:hypothetical protein
MLKDIFTYAYRGSGKYILICCIVLSVIAEIVSLAPLFGAIAGILLSGYFSAVYFQMIQSTATGNDEAPQFPEMANIFEDIIWPMLQIMVVILVSFGPLFVYIIAADESKALISWALLAFGVVYFPMAMLAVVVLGRTSVVSPHIVIPAIIRAGWLHWVSVFMLIFLYVLSNIIENIFSDSLIIGTLVMSAVGSYTLMTQARILGVLYRERQDELGWL